MVVRVRHYTLTGEHCTKCETPLAKELHGNSSKCKLCRKYGTR